MESQPSSQDIEAMVGYNPNFILQNNDSLSDPLGMDVIQPTTEIQMNVNANNTEAIEYQYVEQSVCHTCIETKNELLVQRAEIAELKGKIDAQTEMLGKIFSYSANVDKYISDFLKTEKTVRPSIEAEDSSFETFDDFVNMKKMKTTDDLMKFEANLEDNEFKNKYIRFLRSKYNWSNCSRFSKGDTLFTVIIRHMIDAELFLPYSWKGVNRKRTSSADSESIPKMSFATVHSMFVSFLKQVVRSADRSKAESDVDGMFENLLRFKVQNYVREKKRGDKPHKIPTPRTRLPREQNENSDEANETTPITPSPREEAIETTQQQ